jgi:non-canonical (house-cleaning) NTP pyrophosphatase
VYSTFPGAQIITLAAESGVADQPVGHDVILAGAETRMAHAVAHLSKVEGSGDELSVGFAVGIENGVVELVEDKWVDMAFVVLQDYASGRTTFATSAGVPVEASIVRAALHGGENDEDEEEKGHSCTRKTIGDIIVANAGPGASSDDPHALITGGLTGRRQLLQQAFAIAWGSMQT